MKVTTFFVLLFLTSFSFGQSSRLDYANSKIYVCATYFNQVNKNIGLETKTIIKDTLIDKINFTKFKTENFTDYSKEKKVSYFYETFKDAYYYLLDSSFTTWDNFW
jgi:hypothetical protein